MPADEGDQHVAGHFHAAHAAGDASSAHQEAAVERREQLRVLVGPDDRPGAGGHGGAARRIDPPDVQRVVHEARVKPQHGDQVPVGQV